MNLALELRQLDAVLRAPRPGHARVDRGQVEREGLGVVAVSLARHAEEALRLVVGAEGVHVLLRAARGEQVLAALLVDREVADRRAVLGRHVADRRAVGHGQGRRALAEELDELADDARAAQHLGHGQDEVRRGDALAEAAREMHADDVGSQDVDRLAEHAGLRLDAADSPAHDAEPVDHRRVRVGAHERVGVVDAVLLDHAAGEVLEVDLVDDADSGRDHLEAVERLHAPLQELVARAVAAELDLHVHAKRVGRSPLVDLHGVVDHERDRHEGLDDAGVAVQALDRGAHRGEVDEQRHAGEVLEDDPGDDERDLLGALRPRLPAREGADVVRLDPLAVAVARQRFEDDAEADGQPGDAGQPLALEARQRIQRALAAVSERELVANRVESVHRGYRITP